MLNLVIVIMAGGAGTRFWPLSNEKLPKQFLTLVGDSSLLQESYRRARALCPAERVLVFTNHDYVGLVAAQLPELPASNIFGEPMRRDTAAAVAWASLVCQKRFSDCVIATLTADHLIGPLDAFVESVEEFAWGAEQSGGLYTMGIAPTWPATGYGYLELSPDLYGNRRLHHYKVLQFKEKPDEATAQRYVEGGGYLWNSGMFAWRSDVILAQMQANLPHHLQTLEPVCESRGEELSEAFASLHKISVDFAILEKAPAVFCVKPRFDWTDLGGWLALEPYLTSHEGNSARGRLHAHESEGNLVFCEDPEEQVALLGVTGLVVVRVAGKTLIMPRGRAEDIKALLAKYPELNPG